MEPARRVKRTEEEYLAREARSASKNEFFDGEIYALAGARSGHNVVATNTLIALGGLLRGRPCRAFNSDQRIHVAATGLYTYADGGVACDRWQLHGKDGMSLLNPGLLFEVLSPTTADYDRGEKLEHYRAIPSLQEILLIAQPERLVEHHHRLDAERWVVSRHRASAVELPSLGGTLLLDELYYLSDVEDPDP